MNRKAEKAAVNIAMDVISDKAPDVEDVEVFACGFIYRLSEEITTDDPYD